MILKRYRPVTASLPSLHRRVGRLEHPGAVGLLLGNFPQAFTHLALINAVVHVIRAEEESDSSGVFQPANAPM